MARCGRLATLIGDTDHTSCTAKHFGAFVLRIDADIGERLRVFRRNHPHVGIAIRRRRLPVAAACARAMRAPLQPPWPGLRAPAGHARHSDPLPQHATRAADAAEAPRSAARAHRVRSTSRPVLPMAAQPQGRQRHLALSRWSSPAWARRGCGAAYRWSVQGPTQAAGYTSRTASSSFSASSCDAK